MTIVVGVKDGFGGVCLAADSQGSRGWDKVQRVDPKVFEAHGILYGFTTSYRMGQILRYHSVEIVDDLRETDLMGYVVKCLIPMYREILTEHKFTTQESGVDHGGEFLIGIDGELFTVQSDFQVISGVDYYSAIGCGESYAKGFLFGLNADDDITSQAKGAVNCAKYFSNGCGGDVDFVYANNLPVKPNGMNPVNSELRKWRDK